MPNWPDNDRKMTSHSNFKIKLSERSLHLVRGFLFQFGVIWEVWLPWVLIWLKIGHCKARNVRLAGQRRKNDVTRKLEGKIFWKVFWSSQRFFVSIWCNLRVCLPWVLIWLKIGHCKVRNVRLVEQRRKNDVTQ